MRVLFLSTWFPYPPDNGSKIRAHYLLRALAQRHEVTAVAFCPDGDSRLKAVPGCENARLHAVSADPFRYVALPQWRKFLSPVP
ncbi:MAG: hypothetical protein GX552_11410, partial [Chloroflexi bacterium]|nr:hypothetical protein [Chloroflexota bacterium]